MHPLRPVGMLAALALLLVAVLAIAGCAPREGASCDSDGEYYTHVENGKRTSLKCQYVPDPSGRGRPDRLQWVKA